MSKKIISIPVARHIEKFLKAEYTSKNGVIQIQQRIIPPKYVDVNRYRKYFMDPKDHYIYVLVEAKDSRLYKIYAWVTHINNLFQQKMVDYVAVRYSVMNATEAIREFLSLYDITESEYSFETAYKNWQRSNSYNQLKQKQPQYARNKQRINE